ncbi:DUF2254 domain-containing protein [Cryobacterium psychrophilum]|nr:DUF2254 domain-containing protein [Cryobacterium psychrophilum]TDW28747.1 putative membrane protein [Cryobacterium psychrophilum]
MIRTILLRTRESFWFLPAVFGISAIALALGLVLLDRTLTDNGVTSAFFLDALSASGSRAILSIIGASMLTVAGTTFSITISVLATTSSTYGPRLVRNFMADRANQFVLSVFTSTFLYALVVLQSVHTRVEDNQSFVPITAVYFAVLLAVLNVAVLVFFIHHIADSVQITTLQRGVKKDLTATINLLYPDDHDGVAQPAGVLSSAESQVITSVAGGYVQGIDLQKLVRLGSHHRCFITVTAAPGTHVLAGEEIVEIITSKADDTSQKQLERNVRAAFTLGSARTPRQDIRFALQQLLEIAVRGLASGSNDPYTAVSALDLAGESLTSLFRRAVPPSHLVDGDGVTRVKCVWPTAEELTGEIFAGIRIYGLEHPIVIHAALRLADRLCTAASTGSRRSRVVSETTRLIAAFEASAPDPDTMERVRAASAAVLALAPAAETGT